MWIIMKQKLFDVIFYHKDTLKETTNGWKENIIL